MVKYIDGDGKEITQEEAAELARLRGERRSAQIKFVDEDGNEISKDKAIGQIKQNIEKAKF